MKQLIFIAIILVVMATAWVLYLQHTNNKFQASLPNAPVPTSDADTQERQPIQVEVTPDVLGQEETAELPTPHTDTKAKTKSVSTVEAYTQKLYEGMTSELIETPIEITADDIRNVESPPPWLKPISEMSLEEIEAEVQRRRQALINAFGNTPEVALINKYTTVESLRDGRTTLDREDGLAYIRAIGVLWPAKESLQIVKELEDMQRKGWHASSNEKLQGLPGIEGQ